MIVFTDLVPNQILRIVGLGAPGYAEIGTLVRVISFNADSVLVENENHDSAVFLDEYGAARLEPTSFLDIRGQTTLGTNEFRCACCGLVFEKAKTDEEALQEVRSVFGTTVEASNCEMVCDDCYQELMHVTCN